MKKFAALLMVLSLSVFSIGCTKDDATTDGAGGTTPKADADAGAKADADSAAADADA